MEKKSLTLKGRGLNDDEKLHVSSSSSGTNVNKGRGKGKGKKLLKHLDVLPLGDPRDSEYSWTFHHPPLLATVKAKCRLDEHDEAVNEGTSTAFENGSTVVSQKKLPINAKVQLDINASLAHPMNNELKIKIHKRMANIPQLVYNDLEDHLMSGPHTNPHKAQPVRNYLESSPAIKTPDQQTENKLLNSEICEIKKCGHASRLEKLEINIARLAKDYKHRNTYMDKAMNEVALEMQCSICFELFIRATALNCSHTFCGHCLHTWRKKENVCPMCSQQITSETRVLAIDTLIETMLSNLALEHTVIRTKLILEREGPLPTKKQKMDTDDARPGPSRRR